MNNFHMIRNLAKNHDLRRLCLVLAQMRPGELIDETEVATLIGCSRDETTFLLDVLFEWSAVMPAPSGGGAVARMAA